MKRKPSKIVIMHYIKLIFRSGLFLTALCIYIYNRLHQTGSSFSGFENNTVLLTVIWACFISGMILRFFPSKLESMGCQKLFAKNYKPREPAEAPKATGKSTMIVLVSWLGLNGVLGGLYLLGIFDQAIMLLIALFYSVCDVICILFFCPFQTWMMKNKCCTTCRIYNWDYAMMFTPLVFVPHMYTWSLLGLAVVLLVQWECTRKRHPERFSEGCNQSLSCTMCKERLCHQKVQLQGFLLRGEYNLKGNFLYQKYQQIHKSITGNRKQDDT